MALYQCSVCGYVYDEQEQGKRWSDLPDDWTCPVCGSGKSLFHPLEGFAGDSGQSSGGIPKTFLTQHRIFGYLYLGIYLFFMWQMVPRLWQYQIEFPARTVVHLTLGMAIGAILFLKIAIVRFFRRLDATLVPLLGTSLFVGTVVLIGISVPFAFREALVGGVSAAGGLFDAENLTRVRTLLARVGLEDEAERDRLASPESLRAGRNVLRRDCVECHDLRTVLARPRTAENWRQTVRRMADLTTLVDPIDEDEQWQVTAYLIAISPQLQQSVRKMRAQEELADRSKSAAEAATSPDAEPVSYDAARAKQLFETKCSQCHGIDLVERKPPSSRAQARSLVARMVEEGLSATEDELAQIIHYLTATHVPGSKE